MLASNKENGILYLSRHDVEIACSKIDSVAVIRQVFAMHGACQTVLPDEAYLGWSNEQGEFVRSLNMPGYIGGSMQTAGTKIINSNIANPKRGLPRASGLTLLYEPTTVQVLSIMEAAYISSLRTASVTVLAAELLRGVEIENVAIIGAGVLAQAHIELLVARWPRLRRISLFDLDEQRIHALQERLGTLLAHKQVDVQITTSAEEAIRGAQVVIPVTTTTSGYIQFAWLQPGTVLVNVSLDDALPEVALNADKIIVDDWKLVKNDQHRLLGRMYRAGQIAGPDEPVLPGQRRVDAQLGEIVTGEKVGRSHENEIILVNPFGLAIEDVALATHIYHVARDLHIGMFLPR